MGRTCNQNGRRQEFSQILKKCTPTGKRLLGRPRHRWKDNIRMDLKEIGINIRNWVDSAQDRDCWGAFVNVKIGRAHV